MKIVFVNYLYWNCVYEEVDKKIEKFVFEDVC